MFISKVFSVFFICILVACGNSALRTENTNQQKEKIELSLSMKRSGCYGQCPIYDLTVQSDGKVIFEGKGYTEMTGKVESNLSEEKMNQLIAEINRINFYSLENSYSIDSGNCPNDSTDMPNVKLYIKLNEKEKTIDHYLGCWEDKPKEMQSNSSNEVKVSNGDLTKRIFPQKLYNLENKIDEIVETKRWIGEQE